MEKKSFTIYDIAKAANVSPATVSRVLNENYPVSQKTKEKVVAKIKEYNYQPNSIARSLTSKETKMIGFILPDITNPFFSSVFIEVEKHALMKGYTIFLCNSMSDSKLESLYLNILAERQVEGIIMMGGRINKSITDTDEANEVLTIMKKIPVLMINGKMDGVNCCKVMSDEHKGTKMIVDHLVEMGHKNIGFLGGKEGITSTDVKVQSFKQALKEYDLPYNADWQKFSDFSVQSGMHAMKRLLQQKEWPTALICINDMVASGAITECNNQKINPETFSFVGYDDLFVASILTPSLTSVNHNYEKMGRAVVDLLINEKKNEESKKSFVIEPFLVKRNSTHHPVKT